MNSQLKKITDWQLEQYVLGELDEPSTASIENQSNQDNDLLDRINLIKQSNNEVLIKMPAKAFMQANHFEPNNSESKNSNKPLVWQLFEKLKQYIKRPVFSGVFAACLTVTFAVILLPSQFETIDQNNQDIGVRIKGLESVLNIYKKTGDKVLIDEKLKENDVLQLSYIAGSSFYGYIFSIDGNGIITEHLVDKTEALSLNNNGEIALEYAYKLDDAPMFERFIFVSSEKTFKTESINNKITKLFESSQAKQGELTLSADDQSFYIHSITLNKLNTGAKQ